MTQAVKDMTLIERSESLPLAHTDQSLPTINVAAMFERLAANPGIDVAKLQALVDMQERLLANQARAEFNAAFSAMQSELPVISETRQGDKWKYAPREDIVAAVRPILAKHGFSLSHRTEWPRDQKVVRIVGVLGHRLGHERESAFETAADTSGSKNAVQALGSSTEYGRRYTTLDLLGIATGKDDNGKAAGQGERPQPPEGYDDWYLDFSLTAPNGIAVMQTAFQQSKREYREYLTKHDSARHATLKEKARAADLKAKEKATSR